MTDRGLYDRDGAAHYLSATPRIVDDLRIGGDLLAVQHGGEWKFRRGDLDNYIGGLPPFIPDRYVDSRAVQKPADHGPAEDADSTQGPAELWLTRMEVAARLRIAPKTLDQWAHKRYGPPYARFGKYARYRLADIVAWEDGSGH